MERAEGIRRYDSMGEAVGAAMRRNAERATTVERSGPCRCVDSYAAISPMHDGHCCFHPATQTCHAEEVAAWSAERDRRGGLTSAPDPAGR